MIIQRLFKQNLVNWEKNIPIFVSSLKKNLNSWNCQIFMTKMKTLTVGQ